MDQTSTTAVSERIAGAARRRAKAIRSKPREASTATETVGYARASKDAAVVDGDGVRRRKGKSVSRQRLDGNDLAEYLGLGPVEWFIDNDRSSSDFAERPRYDDLLLRIESGTVRNIVADALDRPGREGVEQAEFLLICEVHGIRIVTVDGDDIDYSGDDPDNAVAMAKNRQNFAEAERNKIRRRTRRGHARRAKGGHPQKGKRAFGFKDDNITHDDDEVALIRSAIKDIRAGATASSIAQQWQDDGVATVDSERLVAAGKAPTRWHPEVVKSLLLSPRMVGKRTHHAKTYDAVWKPIMTEAEQTMIRSRLTGEPTGPKARVAICTGGMLVCGAPRPTPDDADALCGHPLSTFAVKGVRKYRCWKKRGGCGSVSVNAEPVEAIITRLFFHRLDRIYASSRQRVVRDLDDERGRVMAEIERHTAKLRDYVELFDDDLMTRADYEGKAAKRQKLLKAAKAKLAKVPEGDAVAELVSSREQLRADWHKPKMTVELRHAALALLIDHVPIAPATPPINVFNPARVGAPVWRA